MSSIVHFEIPADDLQRAKTFYIDLFGWKFEGVQGMDYMMVDTYEDICPHRCPFRG
jgi:predicted enzyme related to lactoylglutathione lyase